MYLNGEFGDDPNSVNAYAASTFYAVDRYASYQRVWKDDYAAGGLILSDRYTTSNAVHQGGKEFRLCLHGSIRLQAAGKLLGHRRHGHNASAAIQAKGSAKQRA